MIDTCRMKHFSDVQICTWLHSILYMAREVYRLDRSIQHVFNASLLNLSSSRLKIRLLSFQILYLDGLQIIIAKNKSQRSFYNAIIHLQEFTLFPLLIASCQESITKSLTRKRRTNNKLKSARKIRKISKKINLLSYFQIFPAQIIHEMQIRQVRRWQNRKIFCKFENFVYFHYCLLRDCHKSFRSFKSPWC